MTEAENLQRALQADHELKLTAECFARLRERYINDVLNARTPEQAYEGVLSVRVLDSVLRSLKSVIDTAGIDKIGKE